MDAKKSPLALLAQTCSSIGKDTTPSKPIIPPLEKKKDALDRKSCSPKSSKSTDENRNRPSSVKRERLSPCSDGFRTPAPKDQLTPLPAGSRSPDVKPSLASPRLERETSSVSSISGSDHHPTNSSSNSKISLSCGNVHLEVNHHETTSTSSAPASSASASTPSRSSAGPTSVATSSGSTSSKDSLYAGVLPPSLSGIPGAAGLPGMLGHPYGPFDPALAALHAAAKHHGGPLGSSGAISPYSYARVKTAAGATTLVPVCKDPYCTNCQLTAAHGGVPHTPHHPLGSPCPAGCVQCTHDKTVSAAGAAIPTSLPSSLSALHSGLHLPGSLPPPTSSSSASAAASSLPLPSSLYPHPFGVIPGQNHLLYVCNWVQAGSDYCGKRFATSEELLHHLRTHTSAGDMASFAAGLSAYHGLGFGAAAASSAAAAAAFGCHPYPPPAPGSLSPNSALRQAYSGRSLSPNTLLAASRFHPYKSPYAGAGLPAAPSLPSLPNPLSPYYSHYAALYGPRLGAAVAP